MLYTPLRSTFHHTVFSGELSPISFDLIHVSVFLSTALPAPYSVSLPGLVNDWVAVLWYDKSSLKNEIEQNKFEDVLKRKKRNI